MSVPKRSYRGISAQQRRDDRRQQLLEAGLDLLGTQGWRQTTMTAVCSRAGLTERYFYESFSDRDALLLAVLDRIASQIRDVALHALATTDGDPHRKATAAISAFVDLLTSDPRIGRVAMLESAAADPLRTRRHELLREFAQLIARQAHALHGADALSAPHDQIAGLLLTGGLAELLMAWLAGELPVSRQDIIEVAATQFAAATRRNPTSTPHTTALLASSSEGPTRDG
ncbi:TetR/AcrR family transcriptional regulator [Prauserella oleivorans]|uniref:TetR/AcrR family transcriptional regulator n=5 Tax=Pseudonocardiaceae TaxID=2070 RepID=A0A8E1WAD5_9PSEU|nr:MULTISPECIES: TetR/AcrR family transcriptional regulator [Pseudonocardiaceae]PXY18371.1 TetR family transcriptional regulator [Prauserella coralliicola]AXB46208.1 TetR family transcriptional regulator [Amycolatopsis albispora]MBB2506330.1 TetR/AcrR family transcriptional regulator [Amycolatopsis echigonensis]MCF6427970.1 TetR/AcrR family transcriptional regulator [Amycolatopsis tucumanensis]PXY17411.1 TetR family transcriptional regulator [Prauserella muralis]